MSNALSFKVERSIKNKSFGMIYHVSPERVSVRDDANKYFRGQKWQIKFNVWF